MLISTDDLFSLKMKEAERSAKQADNVAKRANPTSVKPQAKRAKPNDSPPSVKDEDFFVIYLEFLPVN